MWSRNQPIIEEHYASMKRGVVITFSTAFAALFCAAVLLLFALVYPHFGTSEVSWYGIVISGAISIPIIIYACSFIYVIHLIDDPRKRVRYIKHHFNYIFLMAAFGLGCLFDIVLYFIGAAHMFPFVFVSGILGVFLLSPVLNFFVLFRPVAIDISAYFQHIVNQDKQFIRRGQDIMIASSHGREEDVYIIYGLEPYTKAYRDTVKLLSYATSLCDPDVTPVIRYDPNSHWTKIDILGVGEEWSLIEENLKDFPYRLE